jgi:hypothetical protein
VLITIVPSSGFMCEIQTTDVLTIRECEFSHTKVATDDTCGVNFVVSSIMMIIYNVYSDIYIMLK